MPRPPAIQWFYKQWLGDSKVLAMEWDATGMHFHLLMLSIQEIPAGSIPNDVSLIRRWLRLPPGASERCQRLDLGNAYSSGCSCPDCVWRRVQPQIFAAWTLRGDRWVNSGMVDTMERQRHYKERYEAGTKKPAEVLKTVIEEEDLHSSKNQNQKQQRQVFVESDAQAPEGFGSSALAVGLLGKLQMVASPHVVSVVQSAVEIAAKAKNLSLEEACDWHLKQAREHIVAGRVVDRFYFEGGMRRWVSDGTKASKGAERTTRNQEVLTASLRDFLDKNAESGGDRDRVQGTDRSGEQAVAKTTHALPSGKD